MIKAVDSNVLLDVMSADPVFGEGSRSALRAAVMDGSLMACDVVWSEIGAMFGSVDMASDALEELDVRFAPLDAEVAMAAGHVWRSYRRGGGTRERAIADFLIGTHALMRADRFVTRDRGFYRSYFRRLRVIDPSQR